MNGPRLFDSDTMSMIIRPRIAQPSDFSERMEAYRNDYGRFAFSIFTRYEIRRGWYVKRAATKLNRFIWFCEHYAELIPVTDSIIDLATELWSIGRSEGHTPGEIDLLIGATAIDQNRPLVTGNTKHYEWMPGLILENWLSLVASSGGAR